MALTYDTKGRIPVTPLTTTTGVATANFTCGADAEVLVVMVLYSGVTARTGGAPTYNSVALTQAQSRQGVTETSCELWYMLAPPVSQALSVSVPNDNARTMWIYIASGNAAAGYTCALDSSGVNATTGTNPTVSVTTIAAGCLIFAVVATGANTFVPTARTGISLYEEDLTSPTTIGGAGQYYVKSNTGAQAMSWTFSTSDDYGAIAVAFKEVLPTITGTLTKTLDGISLSAIGVISVSGSLTKTLDGITKTITGTVDVTGAVSKTLDGIVANLTGVIDVKGDLNKTLDGITLQATGTVGEATITGTLNITLDAVVLNASGAVAVVGNLDKTLDGINVSASGMIAVAGALTKTLDGINLSAVGVVSVSGISNITLDGIGINAAGAVSVSGDFTKTLDGISLAGAGTVEVTSSLAKVLDEIAFSASGTVGGGAEITGALDVILDGISLVSSGCVGVAANFAITLDDLGLQATGAVTNFLYWNEFVGTGLIARENQIIHGNNLAAKLTAGYGSDTYIFFTIPITPNKDVRFQVWTRGDGTNSGRFAIYDVSNSRYLIPVAYTNIPGTAYVLYYLIFAIPVDCTLVQVRLYCPETNGGETYFSEASLRIK
jgi:hypothetical protein